MKDLATTAKQDLKKFWCYTVSAARRAELKMATNDCFSK